MNEVKERIEVAVAGFQGEANRNKMGTKTRQVFAITASLHPESAG